MDKIERAKKFVEEQKYSEAMTLFLEIRNNSSYDCSLEFEIGKLSFIMNNYNSSIEIFAKILKIKFDYNTIILLAKAYKEIKEFRKAIKVLLYCKKYNKKNLSNIQVKEINDLIISLLCHFDHKELAIKFIRKIDKESSSYDIRKLYIECLEDMTQKNIKGLSLKQYSKVIDIIDDIKLKNSILNEYEIYEKKTYLLSKPRRLIVFLTNICNLKCKMCSVIRYQKQQISDTVMKQVFELFPYLEDVVWMGGEVFLYPNFMNLLKLANEYKIKQFISTNGMLINNEIADKIVKYNVNITFSIDSINKDIFEKIRIGSNFQTLENSIKLINLYKKKYGMKNEMLLHYVITKYNCDENLLDVIKFASDNNFNRVLFVVDNFVEQEIRNYINVRFMLLKNKLLELSQALNIQLTYHIDDECDIKKDDKERIIKSKNVKEYLCSIGIKIDFENEKFGNMDFKNKNEFIELCDTKNKNFLKNRGDVSCFMPWKMMTIDINCMVRADCFCPILGNYSKDKLMDIWNNKSFIMLRESIIKRKNINFCNPVCYNSNRKLY